MANADGDYGRDTDIGKYEEGDKDKVSTTEAIEIILDVLTN
jgi:hypothetical protein